MSADNDIENAFLSLRDDVKRYTRLVSRLPDMAVETENYDHRLSFSTVFIVQRIVRCWARIAWRLVRDLLHLLVRAVRLNLFRE